MSHAEFLAGCAFLFAFWAACTSSITLFVVLRTSATVPAPSAEPVSSSPPPPASALQEPLPRVYHRKPAASDLDALKKDEWPEDPDRNWLSFG